MSKQSEAKKAQGYDPKPAARVCSNCVFYASDKVEREGVFGGTYVDESNKRCAIGLFAVKKTATCQRWSQDEA